MSLYSPSEERVERITRNQDSVCELKHTGRNEDKQKAVDKLGPCWCGGPVVLDERVDG